MHEYSSGFLTRWQKRLNSVHVLHIIHVLRGEMINIQNNIGTQSLVSTFCLEWAHRSLIWSEICPDISFWSLWRNTNCPTKIGGLCKKPLWLFPPKMPPLAQDVWVRSGTPAHHSSIGKIRVVFIELSFTFPKQCTNYTIWVKKPTLVTPFEIRKIICSSVQKKGQRHSTKLIKFVLGNCPHAK